MQTEYTLKVWGYFLIYWITHLIQKNYFHPFTCVFQTFLWYHPFWPFIHHACQVNAPYRYHHFSIIYMIRTPTPILSITCYLDFRLICPPNRKIFKSIHSCPIYRIVCTVVVFSTSNIFFVVVYFWRIPNVNIIWCKSEYQLWKNTLGTPWSIHPSLSYFYIWSQQDLPTFLNRRVQFLYNNYLCDSEWSNEVFNCYWFLVHQISEA